MEKVVSIPILCLLFLIACANNIPDSTSLSSSYDGKWEGIAQTPEGPYPIKIEIKNGIISGFIEDSRFDGYITSDNNLIINPFYLMRVEYYSTYGIHTEIICKTDFMSPDRIEGTYYLAKVDKAPKYDWYLVKPATGKPDSTISNVKVNEKEPWTGKFKLESNYQCSGIWGMKQEGQIVKSTRDSAFDFTGGVQGNQLTGKVTGTSNTYYDFTIEMHSNNMSFTGTLNFIAHGLPCQLKGKRIE